MPDIIPLQEGAVYGPIHSRRLGSSLGINVLPSTHKVCSSNCVYCQYGWTRPETSGERLKRAGELLEEVEDAFKEHAHLATPVNCITLAGNGEPTLHPDLEALVAGLKGLRDHYFPSARLGILSDATQAWRSSVRRALVALDDRFMKFDAADEATWRRVNLPMGRGSFTEMVKALKTLPKIVLQSMFIQGSYDNTQEAHLSTWVQAVADIHPLSVQVYTVDRGTAAEGITKVPVDALERIAKRLTATTGIQADVFD